MKKTLVFILFVLSLLPLFSSPCFEEIETVTLSVMASSASKPRLALPGVEIEGEGLFPEKVVFTSSDVSLYYDALTSKPKDASIIDSALFAATQRSSLMQQIQRILLDKGYEKDDLIVDGDISINTKKDPDELELMLGRDLSSISLSIKVDCTLKERGKEWRVKGVLEVFGDSKGNLVVQSNMFTVNSSKYKVDLKYRLKSG
ncbi:MAG: hypothetical protein MR687_10025 [Spirochaetales bacterium]|nr:hypothetical protein [Spirochaetales bacterium]